LISGSKGTVLETFPSLSIVSGAKAEDGSSIYVKDVINTSSEYAWMINFESAFKATGAGSGIVDGKDYSLDKDTDSATKTLSFTDGTDGHAIDVGDYTRGYDYFSDRDQVEVDFLIAPGMTGKDDQVTITNHLTAIASSTRKDCVAVSSPNREALIGVTLDATKVINTIATVDGFTRSSYLVVDNNYLKVYDKYNDKYVLIPAASSTAGIMASTDFNRAPWFSPAGSRRGQLLGVTGIHYSPNKTARDALYRVGVNPIANIAGQGTILFGDKTFLGRPSAFDRINVRRLFLVLERSIGRAAEQALFEFNDEFTRAEFVNIVEPVLREVQGRRGITDFRVVCDETNNTPAVIDRNEFKADIFIKPARSINYVTLNFVAVRTGVDFEEVVGTV
jgi:phage tail sheath protein FI